MDTAEILIKLSESCGTSGSENAAADVAQAELSKYAEVKRDALGNVTGRLKGASKGPRIMLEAHLDEIGMVVTSIDDDGFIKVEAVGGVDRRVLPGCEVTVWGSKALPGVFCTVPPHLTHEKDREKLPSISDMAIDIGFDGKAAKESVKVGDRVTFRSGAKRLLNGQVCGKSLDNRAGVAALLCCAKRLYEEKVSADVTFAFCTREETGQQGAATAAFGIAPEVAVAVDVSFGLTPDSPKIKCGKVGGGPMIGIAPVLSRQIFDLLESVAREKGIACQTEVMGGRSSTDADAIAVSQSGVKTGLVSIPLKYMHTPVEAVAVEDVEGTALLLAEFVKAVSKGILI